MGIAVTERNQLLQQAWQLQQAREFPTLVTLLEPLTEADLLAEPELGYVLASAWRYTGQAQRGLELIRKVGSTWGWRGNDWVNRLRLVEEGNILFELGFMQEAEQVYLELLEAARDAGDEVNIAVANGNIGMVQHFTGRVAESLVSYDRSLVSYRNVGHRRGIATSHGNLAMAYRQLGLLGEATKHLDHCVPMARAAGAQEILGLATVGRAFVQFLSGDLRLASATAQRAKEHFVRLGTRPLEGEALRALGIIAVADGRLAQARSHLDAALGIALDAGRKMLEAEVLEELAVLEQREGNAAASEQAAAQSVRLYREMGAQSRADQVSTRLADEQR